MTEAELLGLIAREEDHAVECKAAVLSRREIAEYAVGIGNAGGGWLIMGVSDRRPRRIFSARMPSGEEVINHAHRAWPEVAPPRGNGIRFRNWCIRLANQLE